MSINTNYFNKNICLLVIQRGLGTQKIFCGHADYKLYFKLMKHYKDIFGVRVFAFCFLESSVYIVVGACNAKIAAEFLGEINRSFSVLVSGQDEQRDPLCIQRYKMLVIEDDRALYDLVSFVESFPVKQHLVAREQDYEWSSFRFRMHGLEDGVIESLDLCP